MAKLPTIQVIRLVDKEKIIINETDFDKELYRRIKPQPAKKSDGVEREEMKTRGGE